MRTACYENYERYEGDYVGKWYDGQTNAQCVYFNINVNGSVDISANGEIGNAISSDIWHGRALRFKLPSNIYTQDEVDEMLEIFGPYADKLCESYEERWDGNNYVGKWSDELRMELQKVVNGYESSISWGEDEV